MIKRESSRKVENASPREKEIQNKKVNEKHLLYFSFIYIYILLLRLIQNFKS